MTEKKVMYYHRPAPKKRINRFTRTRAADKARTWQRSVRLTVVFGLAGAGIWWLFFSGSFTLINITLPETKNLDRQAIANLLWQQAQSWRWLIFPQNNLLVFDAAAAQQTLSDRFYLSNLQIRKKLGHTLTVSFAEKDYALIWQEGERYYYINFQGEIILVKNEAAPNLTIIHNRVEPKAGEKRVAVEEKYLLFADRLHQAWGDKVRGLKNKEIFLDNDVNTVKVQIINGPVLLFNTEGGLDKQLLKLETIRRQELADGPLFDGQHYLDLRYGDRVFYQ